MLLWWPLQGLLCWCLIFWLKSLRLIYRSGTRRFHLQAPWSSNELQWLDYIAGYQHSSVSNCHQGDLPPWQTLWCVCGVVSVECMFRCQGHVTSWPWQQDVYVFCCISDMTNDLCLLSFKNISNSIYLYLCPSIHCIKHVSSRWCHYFNKQNFCWEIILMAQHKML